MYISRKILVLSLIVAVAMIFMGAQWSRYSDRPRMATLGRGGYAEESVAVSMDGAKMASSYLPPRGEMGIAPVPPFYSDNVVGGQMFIQDTSLALVSRDPADAEQKIRQIATELGGFLVSSQLSRPEEGATATVVVRVPTDKLEEALSRFEEVGERVVNKSIQGEDVTEQYQDIEARLATLNTTQARLEALMEQATEASDLLQIQQQISQIQDQKDMLEGQRRYLTEASNLTRVTVHLASDELALPYVPAEPWRPEAIFRQAVRSLVSVGRGAGTVVIWGVVYLPVLLPLVVLGWWLNRRSHR